jgi:hypothetical protein
MGRGTNKYWGSEGAASVASRMEAAGLPIGGASADCGDMANPCTMGAISAAFGVVTSGAVSLKAISKVSLEAMRLSPTSVSKYELVYGKMVSAYGTVTGVPCWFEPYGSTTPPWNLTHFDAFTGPLVGREPGSAFCEGLAADALAACEDLWVSWSPATGSAFPRCPETTISEVPDWGVCEAHQLSCPETVAYYDTTNPMFMEWWTIFYWAWWITWAPFVGFFVALISRGRTVRQVIVGGFFAPTLFAILWFSVFGAVGIKMERVAELALHIKPDYHHALATCGEHYSGGGLPITPESKALAAAGFYKLSCLPRDDQIYRIMEQYTNLTGFLQLFLWPGLFIYFLTSSDSGSMVDDVIGASGLSAERIPGWQKIFWCCTEGLVAIALISTGDTTSMKAIQAMSIIIALPYTGLLCMLVPSCYRVMKKEAGDEDIKNSFKFNTQLLDFLEGFKPAMPSPCSPGKHLCCILSALFVPAISVYKCSKFLYPKSCCYPVMMALLAQTFYILFFALQIAEAGLAGMHAIGWLMHIFFVSIVTFTRVEMRYHFSVWGTPVDDACASLFMFPFVLAQCQMMAETNGKNAPHYFDDADQVIADMAMAASGASLPVTDVKAVVIPAEGVIAEGTADPVASEPKEVASEPKEVASA